MQATINDALHFVRSMSDRARGMGYLLAPYGSTILNDRGRDVDVLAVPWRSPNSYRELIEMLCERGGYMEAGERHFGLMGTCAVLLRPRNPGAPDIDLQIREVPRTEEVLTGLRRAMADDVAGW